MGDDLEALRSETLEALAQAQDHAAWDAIRVGVLGKSGRLTRLLKELGKMSPEERKERGQALNRLRDALNGAVEQRGQEIAEAALESRLKSEQVDVTLPAPATPLGLIHPISRTIEEMTAIFGAMASALPKGRISNPSGIIFRRSTRPTIIRRVRSTTPFTFRPRMMTLRRACCAPRHRACRFAPC